MIDSHGFCFTSGLSGGPDLFDLLQPRIHFAALEKELHNMQ